MQDTLKNLSSAGKAEGLTLHGITFAHVFALQDVVERAEKARSSAEWWGRARPTRSVETLKELRDALLDALTGGDLRRCGLTSDHVEALRAPRRRELRAIGRAWRSGRKRSIDAYAHLLSIHDALNEVAAIVASANPVEAR